MVRWTGSYGLVQADKLNASPMRSAQGKIHRLVIVFLTFAPSGRATGTALRTG